MEHARPKATSKVLQADRQKKKLPQPPSKAKLARRKADAALQKYKKALFNLEQSDKAVLDCRTSAGKARYHYLKVAEAEETAKNELCQAEMRAAAQQDISEELQREVLAAASEWEKHGGVSGES
jgi:hypothetical protein